MINQDLANGGGPSSFPAPFPTAILGLPFVVELGFFSGPLDLLLHLVRRAEVPIAEVEMSLIADQYLQIVQQATQLDVEIATEFIVVAATLLALKSESLLPGGAGLGTDEGYEDSAQFYEELRERLKRYEQTKLRAETLNRSAQLGVDIFTRFDREMYRVPQEVVTEERDLEMLPMLFVKLLKRIGERVDSLRIRLEPISVVDFMMRVVDTLQGVVKGAAQQVTTIPQTFRALIAQLSGVAVGSNNPQSLAAERSTVIGGFIAMLELVKRGVIAASQADEQTDIDLMMRLSGDETIEPIERELIEAEYGNFGRENVVEFRRTEIPLESSSEQLGQLEEFAEERKKEVNRD